MPRGAVRESQKGKLRQRLYVHVALEIDDLAHGIPIIDPSVLIELRLRRTPKVELCVLPPEPQQKPSLFLPDALREAVSSNVFRWEAIPQPARSLADELHV